MCSLPLAAVAIEVPPGNAILRADYARFSSHERRQAWDHCSQAVRLQGKQHDIDWTNLRRVISRRGPRFEISERAAHAHAVLLHCAQMRSTRDQRHVFSGP